MLKLTAASVTGAVVAGEAGAKSNGITVTQDGQSYEVSPLSNGQTIGEFYDWYNAESHTTTDIERSDTSLLFLWDGPNGLSLVVIHDRADDRGGGAVTFEFEGLPSDGSWVVRDDDPGNDTYFGNSKVDWQWVDSKTDGGAYRDVSGARFTIRPQFYDGISEWQLLTGDASNPDRISLDRGSSVTVAVDGSSGRDSLGTVRDEKLAMASQVDSLGRDINERPDVAETLEALEAGVDDGSLDEPTAVEAVERMKLGENVTEELLADFGPERLGDEDPDTLVGNPPGDTEYSTTSRVVQSGLNILTETILTFFPFDRVADFMPSWLTSKIDTAKSKLSKFIDFVVDTLIGSYEEVARKFTSNSDDIAQTLLEFIRDEGISKGADLAKSQANEVTGVLDTLADLLVGIYEDDLGADSIESKLSDLNESFTPTDGSLSLSGSLDGAETAANDGIDAVHDRVAAADDRFETIASILDVVGWLGLAASVLTVSGFFTIAGKTLDLVLLVINIAGNLFGIGTAALDMLTAVEDHNGAIDGVVAGGS